MINVLFLLEISLTSNFNLCSYLVGNYITYILFDPVVNEMCTFGSITHGS